MKLFYKGKDGGPESKVTGFWLIESKAFGSIALLKFDRGFRDAYHTHAFHAISWLLFGELKEITFNDQVITYKPSLIPIWTPKKRYHQVQGVAKTSWALTFRGPWENKWKEYLPDKQKEISLTHGRKIVDT